MHNRQIPIRSWKQFVREVRSRGCHLLERLDEFPNSILVTGCQRSGTTMLSRIISLSDGMVDYWFGRDDELDAALILAGVVDHPPRGRYCFQTTYLNECYREYFRHRNGHKIIWLFRNPFAVVYSMLNNWNRFALHQLFLRCGVDLLSQKEKKRHRIFGKYGIRRLRKACYAYVGKTRQAFELQDTFSREEIFFVDYDDLVDRKQDVLSAIYDFVNLDYKSEYAEKIHRRSVGKSERLSRRQKEIVEEICLPVYEEAKNALL
jgi:hypothetical protein